MARAVSSSDSSLDDTGLQEFKAAQAAQFLKLTGSGPPNGSKFKEAQMQGLRGDTVRHSTPPKKSRPNSVDQTRVARSTPHQHHQQQQPTSAAQLLQLLGSDKRETSDTRKLLHAALVQLDSSSRRLAQSETERRALEAAGLAQTTAALHSAAVVQQGAAAAQAELSLYKLQMETAQREIERAQGVVRALEVQRDDAERAATRARAVARKLHVEKMAVLAREEGRKQGYETGFGHGRIIAAAKERRRIEERRVEEAQQRRIQMAPPVVERGGAFIEEESEREDGRGNLSREMPQQQTRRPRDSLESVRRGEPEPIRILPSNSSHQLPRRPASAMSTSSARRVSAPPASVQQPPQPRGRTSSDVGARSSSRAGSAAVIDRPPTRSSSTTVMANGRASTASRSSPLNANNANTATTSNPRRRSGASSFEAALGTAPGPMRMDALLPQTVSMPVPNPAPAPPMEVPVMPQHIPMPPPPPGAIATPTPLAMPAPPPEARNAPLLPQPPLAFEVERPERRSPSSVSTSLRTLRLTSFPLSAGPGSEAGSAARDAGLAAARERDREAGMGGMGAGRGLSVILEDDGTGTSQLGRSNSWGQGRTGTPYSDPRVLDEWRRGTEEAPRNTLPPPSPLTSPGMLSPHDARAGNPNMQPQRSQETVGSSNLRRSSSGSSSQTVNITIVPPSRPPSAGLTTSVPSGRGGTGGFLSPNHAHDTPVVPEEDEDDEDTDTDDDSEDGMPPRALGPLPLFAQGVTYPPGFQPMTVTPLATLQSLPPLNVNPMANARPPSQQQTQTPGWAVSGGSPLPLYQNPPAMGANNSPRPASRQMNPLYTSGNTWVAPPLMGANDGPARPASRQMNSIYANPNGAAPTWAAPPLIGANDGPLRPSSRAGAAWTFGGQFPFGQNGTPGPGNPQPPLGFPVATVNNVPVEPSGNAHAQHGPPVGFPVATVNNVPVEPSPHTAPPLGFPVPTVNHVPLEPPQRAPPLFPVEPLARPGTHAAPPLGFPVATVNNIPVEPPGNPPRATQVGFPIATVNSVPIEQPARLAAGAPPLGFPVATVNNVPVEPPVNPLRAPQVGFPVATVNNVPIEPPAGGAPPVGFPVATVNNTPIETPGGRTAPPLGFPVATVNNVPIEPGGRTAPLVGFPVATVNNVPIEPTHSGLAGPQPTRPQSFMAGNSTPKAIYAGTPGAGYFAPTPNTAAGFPLPPSVSGSSPATNANTPRHSLYAGATPAGFNRDFRSNSRTSSRASAGVSRYNNNQTPANANRIPEESDDSASETSLGFDQMTQHNTHANANIYSGGPVIPSVIPPSPARSYRPMR